MGTENNLHRVRNDFAFAAVMFTATAGGSLWIGSSMNQGERLDMHSRLPQTSESQEFATLAENILLVPCMIFPLLSAWNFSYRQKKYREAKDALRPS